MSLYYRIINFFKFLLRLFALQLAAKKLRLNDKKQIRNFHFIILLFFLLLNQAVI